MEYELGKIYRFDFLEKLLSHYDSKFLIRLRNIEYNSYCMMWLFQENFSREYQSGDGVLFYEDGDSTSANPGDEFEMIEIINIKP